MRGRVQPAEAAQTALALVVAALFTVLSALLCLFLGLKMPNLHWTSEITPIKQGGAVALALLGGVVYAALLAAGLLPDRLAYRLYGIHGRLCRGDAGSVCAAAPLDQDEGLHRVCKSVKKVPCGYIHKNSPSAQGIRCRVGCTGPKPSREIRETVRPLGE